MDRLDVDPLKERAEVAFLDRKSPRDLCGIAGATFLILRRWVRLHRQRGNLPRAAEDVAMSADLRRH